MLFMDGTSEGSFGDLLLHPVFFWVCIEVALLAAWLGGRRLVQGRPVRVLHFLRTYLCLILR